MDMKVVQIDGNLTVDFARNGSYLGTAYDIKDLSSGMAFRPLTSLHRKGDSVSISQIDLSEFSTAIEEPDSEDITGVWESDTEPRYVKLLFYQRCSIIALILIFIYKSQKSFRKVHFGSAQG